MAGLLTNRRLALAIPVLAIAGVPVALGLDEPSSLQRYEFSSGAMGTEFRVVLYTDQPGLADEAAQAAFERIEALDRLLSDYRPDSELTALSAGAGTGTLMPVSEDTWRVLLESESVATATGGAFDVTVGPLTRLWRRAARRQRLPEEDRLDAALAAVGHEALQLDHEARAVRLLRPGMRIDLGGVAKGYAVDAAFELLRSLGIEHALVDGGGDVRVGESPPSARGWRVSVPARDAAGELDWRSHEVSHTAIATSGPGARSLVVDGIRYSHLIDPRTGRGVSTDRWVTVFAPTTARADALASALSVLGDDGLDVARSMGATEMWVIETGFPGDGAGSNGTEGLHDGS